MAWVTTKDGRHVNTEWFEDKEEGKKREHTPLSEQKKEADNEKQKPSIDLSVEATYKLSGQQVPKDLPRVTDAEAKENKEVDYNGVTYTTQALHDVDGVAGHLYIPHQLDKGSFFVAKDGSMWHDGSQYLYDKVRKNRMKEEEKQAKSSTEQKDISLDKIKSYGYDPADATGDPTIINADGESYYKVGENKWKRHASSGRVLSDSISDEKLAETLASAKDVKVMPSQKKNAKSLTEQMKEANVTNKESFVVGNNPPTSKEEAYMNYNAIKISKHMPKEKQEELRKLKAKYYKIWKGSK